MLPTFQTIITWPLSRHQIHSHAILPCLPFVLLLIFTLFFSANLLLSQGMKWLQLSSEPAFSAVPPLGCFNLRP